jgi:hypothetical protein
MAKHAQLKKLYKKHVGQDIYVLGSGPTVGYFEKNFFQGKITIGINYIYKMIPVDYVIVKEFYAMRDAVRNQQNVVASKHHCGNTAYKPNVANGHYFIFDHFNNELEVINYDALGSMDKLVVSYSTITSGIHLAAFMGADNIILVGHDCGSINGNFNAMEYWDGKGKEAMDFNKSNPKFYKEFLGRIEPQTIELKKEIKRVYGCSIYSMNPWINLGLEDNIYESYRA